MLGVARTPLTCTLGGVDSGRVPARPGGSGSLCEWSSATKVDLSGTRRWIEGLNGDRDVRPDVIAELGYHGSGPRYWTTQSGSIQLKKRKDTQTIGGAECHDKAHDVTTTQETSVGGACRSASSSEFE